jgi:hypothetical protein
MKETALAAVLVIACGCQPMPPGEPVRYLRPRAQGPVPESVVVCTFDAVTLPRSQYDKFEHLWQYMELGGTYGPSEKLLGLNGLKVGRTDMRFRTQFTQGYQALVPGPRRVTYVRLAEGNRQTFDVGDVLREETLFVWVTPDSLVGRHFTQVRYSMCLTLEKVNATTAEFEVSWQARTGYALNRNVNVSPLEIQAVLEEGQSLVIGPADFTGRGVGRAFLIGVEEKAVQMTFFVITPTEIRKKTELPGDRASAPRGKRLET